VSSKYNVSDMEVIVYASLPASSIKWPSEGCQKDHHHSPTSLNLAYKGMDLSGSSHTTMQKLTSDYIFFVLVSKTKRKKKLNYT